MDFKHKNHLISTYITFHKQLKEIKDIICNGNAPSGTNTVLTPLSEKMQNAILSRLEKISILFDEIAHKYFSEELQAKLKREPASATRMWASIQLRQMEEDLSDLHPNNFEKKYGSLESEEKDYLEEIIDKIMQEIAEAEKLI